MRRAYLAVPFAFALTSTAHAADTVAQVAILTSGLVDGAQTMIGGFGTGPVTMPEPGFYEVSFDKGVIKFLFDEVDTCRVNVHAEIPSQGGADLRYDLTKVTNVGVDDRGKFEGQNAVLVTLEGEDVVQSMMGDNWVTQPGFAFLVGSLTVAEYQAAADELQRIC
jgi:hypothetical protein